MIRSFGHGIDPFISTGLLFLMGQLIVDKSSDWLILDV